jgi:hypothetical protein
MKSISLIIIFDLGAIVYEFLNDERVLSNMFRAVLSYLCVDVCVISHLPNICSDDGLRVVIPDESQIWGCHPTPKAMEV